MPTPDRRGSAPAPVPESELATFEVLAGGGVVWRPGPSPGTGDIEVLVVHRDRYGDWTFPKGKLDPGETLADCARREVLEETGIRGALGAWLADVPYVDHKGRSKLVRYWEMTVVGGAFAPNDEVDAVRWLPPGGAREILSYRHDRPVLERLAAVISERTDDHRG